MGLQSGRTPQFTLEIPSVETNKAVPRDDQQTMNRQTGSIHGLDAPKRFLLERKQDKSDDEKDPGVFCEESRKGQCSENIYARA
ncbi:hypothetical protein JHK87_033655 [Glycine soja]|nr:hypothetical protein JHK87_033655 [Glycine soja]